jgi:Zn-finger nucleic acid-binding protein
MDQAVAPVWSSNQPLLSSLAETPRAASAPVRYRPCPSCGELMNRNLQGRRSGVVVDRCRDHGLWLDAGELRQLMEWARAGGALLDQERREQDERIQLASLQAERPAWPSEREPDLLTLLIRLARQLL